MTPEEKLEILKNYIRDLGSIAIGFSGGVDSTFLLKVASEVLGDKCLAVTAVSDMFPSSEKNEAEKFCKSIGVQQVTYLYDEMQVPGLKENPKDRCYICKKALFGKISEVARENGIDNVAEGSNMDDLGDYRPGLKAVAELGILSPLRNAQFYKSEIRYLSEKMKLPTWDKPSFACLASRFVYGEEITPEKLKMVEHGEDVLKNLGFKQFRVRIHGMMCRIEVLPEDIEKIVSEEVRSLILREFEKIGFSYVSLDLKGYRTGSMNEEILK